MKDKDGNQVAVTEENAGEIALRERELEAEGKDPENELFEPTVENKSAEELQQEENKRLLEADEETLSEPDKEKRIELIKEREETQEKTDEELLSANPDDLKEDEKTKRTELIEAEETETKRLLDMKEEEAEGDDIEKRKTAVLKAETKQKEEFETRVTTYAEKKKVSADDARKTLESANKIVEKYSGNSEQIAIANLGLQHLVAEKDEEILAVRQEANQPKRPHQYK